MGRITSFSKQVIVFFLVTSLIIRPTFAANVGGWSMGNPVAQGASAVYTGTKNVIINGADFVKKGTAKITPPASSVAKVLARGVAGYALSVAVEQLIGAVDWVLDPANNQIKYYLPNDPDCTANQCKVFYYIYNDNDLYRSTPQAACSALVGSRYIASSVTASIYYSTTNTCKLYVGDQHVGYTSLVETGTNPNAEEQEQEERKLPLEVVAQKVISNANNGDTDAQVATMSAAADIVDEASKDETKAPPIVGQLEASAKTTPADAAAADTAGTGTGTQTKDPANPDVTNLTLEFPIFCNWAPSVCEAAQVVISFPQTLTDWWETAKSKSEEWSTSISEAWSKVKDEYNEKPKEDTDTELDIPDQSDPNINTDLSFGGSCPASRSVPVSFAGIHTEIEFSFQWFCEVASIAKPVVISISAFAAALIVAGVRTEDD